MSEKKKKELQMKNQEVMQAYADVVFLICKSFKDNIEEAARAIECYQSLFVENFEINGELSTRVLQNTILKCSSWLHCELLHFVVNQCGGDKEKKLLEQYIQGPLKIIKSCQ